MLDEGYLTSKTLVLKDNPQYDTLILKKLYYLVPHSGMEMTVKWHGHFSSCF